MHNTNKNCFNVIKEAKITTEKEITYLKPEQEHRKEKRPSTPTIKHYQSNISASTSPDDTTSLSHAAYKVHGQRTGEDVWAWPWLEGRGGGGPNLQMTVP